LGSANPIEKNILLERSAAQKYNSIMISYEFIHLYIFGTRNSFFIMSNFRIFFARWIRSPTDYSPREILWEKFIYHYHLLMFQNLHDVPLFCYPNTDCSIHARSEQIFVLPKLHSSNHSYLKLIQEYIDE
jgi:hypothetical protein